jgi:AraC-like DNA-binding protein
MESLYGRLASELAEKANTLPPSAAFRAMENFLINRLPMSRVDDKQIRAVVGFAFQQKGVVEVADLADYANLSTRTLQRRFEEVVGYSPKVFARVVRFDYIKDELMFNPALNLTDLAYRFGYFDQAHFIQDFKQLTGKTPSVFAESVIDREIAFYK